MESETVATELKFKDEYDSLLFKNIYYKVRTETKEDGEKEYVASAHLKDEDTKFDVFKFKPEQLISVMATSDEESLDAVIISSCNISIGNTKDGIFRKVQDTVAELNNLTDMYLKLT